MKKYKSLALSILTAVSAVGITSCSDFLDENLITQENQAAYTTTEGLDKLVTGMYQTLKFHYNYVWAITTTQFGTDEMAVGNDATEAAWNDYTSVLNSTNGHGVAEVWDNMYSGIASANTVIQNVPQYYDKSSKTYNTRLGEGYFIRGFNYLKLVRQYGGVPLQLVPLDKPVTEFARSSAEETLAQVISDLKSAYNLLPEKPDQVGRATKSAAAHFLAKAYLFRASEINDGWNAKSKSTDLDSVIIFGKEVIAAHPLCPDFASLWDFTAPNSANESVSEVVLAAQFSDNTTTQGRYGNQLHLYYPSVYQNMAGLARDISGGREFSRLRTTDYAMDVYDRVNDSRFWKSFITSYRCNKPDGAPRWDTIWVDKKPVWIPSTSLIDYVDSKTGRIYFKRKFTGGEEAIRYIVNNAGDDRYNDIDIQKRSSHMFIRYFKGESKSYIGAHGNNGTYVTKSRYVALSKFRDGSRISIASQFGQRDGILARSAEDYLMVAEALGRQGKYSEALPYINALRERAGYADGEVRSKNVDGGQAYKKNSYITKTGDGGAGTGYAVYSETNTYFESNNMLEGSTTASTKSSMKLSSVSDILNSKSDFYTELGCSTDAEKFLCFILNERSRELMGELLRWEDLSRTKTLEKRWKTFNDGSVSGGGTFNAGKHYLRPIPQTFLDALEKNGQGLTADEKQAVQNPGW